VKHASSCLRADHLTHSLFSLMFSEARNSKSGSEYMSKWILTLIHPICHSKCHICGGGDKFTLIVASVLKVYGLLPAGGNVINAFEKRPYIISVKHCKS